MKKLTLVFIVTLALSAVAMASDIAFYVGSPNTDGWYDVATMTTDVQTIVDQAGYLFVDIQQFNDDQFDAFGQWVDRNTDDGEMDILWLNGCMPSVLYPNANIETDGSRAELWLDGGNMIINVGDWFAYTTWEGGTRGTDNGSAGAGNILDLDAGIIVSADNTTLTVTPTGTESMPSLGDSVPSDRPIALSQVVAPWEVAAIFASTGGTDNPSESQADPVILHNTETDGYIAFVNQGGSGHWLDDRGSACAEMIVNWVAANAGLSDKALASNPSPESGQIDLLRDIDLSWTAGENVVSHDVYFGTSLDSVADATRANPMDVLVSLGQAAASYDLPGVLDFGVTYYWRVDEVDAAGAIETGLVWTFTVESFAYPVPNVVATSNTSSDPDRGPERLVDGSGLNADDQHSNNTADMWGGKPNAEGPSYVEFTFDSVYKLDEMWVWNYNMEYEIILGFGAKDVTIEYSENGTDWTVLGDFEFTRASGSSTYTAGDVVDFQGLAVKSVRMTVQNNFGGSTTTYGLSEVRFMYIPAQASQPTPADGAADVAVETTLSWRPGREAVSHEIYLGTDPNALTMAGTAAQNSFSPTALDLATTYAWQVVEVNEADAITAWAGAVWTFSTQEYIEVEGFETYDDDIDAATTIWQTWIDGLDDTTNGGSMVGNDPSPFAEQTIVHGGTQSLPLYYDNGSVSAISETDRNFASGQDWTASDIKGLSLWFYGAEGNGGQLYVKINGTKMLYDGHAVNIQRPAWQSWSIDLSTVGNVSNVTQLSVGIQGTGSGVIYIDDIRLYPDVPEYLTPDITGAGDTVVGVPNDADWPAAETPDLAIDDNANTKFLHFKGGSEPTGIQVAPLLGSTLVTGLALTSANDAATRDPITFELSGSNTSIDGPYQLIASGDVVDFAGDEEWPRFTKTETPIEFNNTTAYRYYQIVFPTVRGDSETLMQIAEIELIGTVQ